LAPPLHEAPKLFRQISCNSSGFLSPLESSTYYMASVLEVLCNLLRILRIARDHFQRFPGRGASLLSFIVRKFNALWRFCFGKPGTSRTLKPAEPPFLGTKTRPYSLSGDSAVVKEYTIAASTVPTSASHPSLHEHAAEREEAVTALSVIIPSSTPANLSVDAFSTSVPFEGRSLAHRSSGNLSIQSRASDRRSIITNSRDSIRAPLGQPSRAPRATHRQFGRGPDPSRSREVSRSPSPMAHAAYPQPPRVEIDTTNLPSSINDDSTDSPVFRPSSPYQHEPLSPPSVHGHRRRQSSTSVVVAVENPSTESLPLSTLINPPKLTDEPFAVGSPTARSSPVSVPVDQRDDHSLSSTSSIDYFVPEGRFVQLINSDQVPRYTKDITMQVVFFSIVLRSRSRLLADPARKHLTT